MNTDEFTKPPKDFPGLVHPVVMPWSKRAEQLLESEGPYCEYAAWREWMAQFDGLERLLGESEIDNVHLFSAFVKACEQTRKPNSWKVVQTDGRVVYDDCTIQEANYFAKRLPKHVGAYVVGEYKEL